MRPNLDSIYWALKGFKDSTEHTLYELVASIANLEVTIKQLKEEIRELKGLPPS